MGCGIGNYDCGVIGVTTFRVLTPEEFSRWLKRAVVVGLIGVLAGVLLAGSRVGGAAVLCMAMAWPMAVMGSLSAYRTERGLWMLAGLIGAGIVAFHALVITMQIRDWMRGAPAPPWHVALAAGVVMFTLHVTMRVCWTVIVVNWAVSRDAGS